MTKRTRPLPSLAAQRQAHPAVARPRSDDANAFIPDPGDGPAHTDDDLAESLAEEFVGGATGVDADDEAREALVSEEIGGPFIETSAAEEFAEGTDDANPPGAKREPLPRAGADLLQAPPDQDDD
jgi:hypothetical protein